MVVSCKQGGLTADAAPDISKLTAEMFEATDLDDPSAGSDDNDDELDVNELIIDIMD